MNTISTQHYLGMDSSTILKIENGIGFSWVHIINGANRFSKPNDSYTKFEYISIYPNGSIEYSTVDDHIETEKPIPKNYLSIINKILKEANMANQKNTGIDFGAKKTAPKAKAKAGILESASLTTEFRLAEKDKSALTLQKKITTAMALDPYVIKAAKQLKGNGISLSSYIQEAILEKLNFTLEQLYEHFERK